MTDNEIIKALECCCIEHTCIKCPYIKNNKCGCINGILKDSLDLINRLQTENKELHNAFINEKRMKVVQARTIKEFIEKCVLTFACGRSDDRTECYICENDFLEIMKEIIGEDE